MRSRALAWKLTSVRQKVASARSSTAPGDPRAFTPRSSPAPPLASGRTPGPDASRHTRFHASILRPWAGHHGRRQPRQNRRRWGPYPLSLTKTVIFFPIKYFMTQRDLMREFLNHEVGGGHGEVRGHTQWLLKHPCPWVPWMRALTSSTGPAGRQKARLLQDPRNHFHFGHERPV